MNGIILTILTTPVKEDMKSILIDGIEYRFFNHLYAISYHGKVLRKLALYKPTHRKDGYLEAGRNGLLHRIVALLWLDRPNGTKIVHHKDGNKRNNSADNLEWITQKEHMGDRHKGQVGHYRRTKAIIAKISASRTGFKDTAEVAARKRDILANVGPKRACEIDGVAYRSILFASTVLGIHVSTVRLRCFSKNFPNYKIVEK